MNFASGCYKTVCEYFVGILKGMLFDFLVSVKKPSRTTKFFITFHDKQEKQTLCWQFRTSIYYLKFWYETHSGKDNFGFVWSWTFAYIYGFTSKLYS